MARSKRPRRHYSAAKSRAIAIAQKERTLRRLVAPLAVVHVSGGDMAELYHLPSGQFLLASLDIDYALRHYAFAWSVYHAAFCVDQFGLHYHKPSARRAEHPATRDEIADELRDSLDTLLAGANPAHLRGYGWIACPAGHTPTMAQAEAIFAPLNPYRVRTAEELAADADETGAELANLMRDREWAERREGLDV